MKATLNVTPSSTVETEEFWQTHEKLQNDSELSRAAYCRQNNLNYFRFCHWIKKSRQNSTSTNKLVSVKLKPATDHALQTNLCTLELKNGRSLKIHDIQVLSFILERMG